MAAKRWSPKQTHTSVLSGQKAMRKLALSDVVNMVLTRSPVGDRGAARRKQTPTPATVDEIHRLHGSLHSDQGGTLFRRSDIVIVLAAKLYDLKGNITRISISSGYSVPDWKHSGRR